MARLVPSWTRLDKQQERDVRELIRRVSGLQDEADPNFQLALNFAWSNFRCAAREPCAWVPAARRGRGCLRGRGWACGWVAGLWRVEWVRPSRGTLAGAAMQRLSASWISIADDTQLKR